MDDRAESIDMVSATPREPAVPRRRRVSSEQRRGELIEAAVRLIGTLGLTGTTVSKISAEVGLSEMAAYRHFESKSEMLMEANSYLLGRILAWLDCSTNRLHHRTVGGDR